MVIGKAMRQLTAVFVDIQAAQESILEEDYKEAEQYLRTATLKLLNLYKFAKECDDKRNKSNAVKRIAQKN